MLPWIGLAIAGVWLGRRGKPKTPMKKYTILGSKSGIGYEVEDFHEAGFLVVSRPKILKATLKRSNPGFQIMKASGTPIALKQLHSDFDSNESKTNG